jgi:hypothetical protein
MATPLLESEARTLLLADSALAAIVGTRITLGEALQDTPRPYIVIVCGEQETIYAQGANAIQTQGIASIHEIIEVSGYANDYATARTLEWHIRRVLEGKPTTTSTSPWLLEDGGWEMIGPNFETQSGADQRGWQIKLPFEVWRKEIWTP